MGLNGYLTFLGEIRGWMGSVCACRKQHYSYGDGLKVSVPLR
jgi:hypothetical protein